jgi:hypothetical protein
LRERRWVSRYRRKLAYLRAAEKNRRHKVRDDAGITLGLASGAALGPGHPEAAGQRKSGKPRQGNAVIRSILGAWAPAARGTPSVFGAKSGSLGVRRGHPKALVARAHQLRRTIFFVLTPRPPYRDAGFDDAAANVAKHAPRGIQALKRSGDWPQVVATA